MSLDEDLRRRLRVLAHDEERDRETLSEETRARIAAHVAREGAAIARRHRMTVVGGRAVAVVLAAAAAALFFARPTDRAPRPDRVAVVAPPRVAPPACASAPSSTMPRTSLVAEARTELDQRARLVSHGETLASFEASSSCRAEVTLVSGTVDVWARELRGGELVVHAGEISVIVHGTIFRVVRGAEYAVVAVDEGRVEVRAPGMQPAFVVAGESLRLQLEAARVNGVWTSVRESLAVDERTALHAISEDEAATRGTGTRSETAPTTGASARGTDASPSARATSTTPEDTTSASPSPSDVPSIDAILLQAERAYRDGHTDDARRLFRTAGSMRGPDAEAAWLRLGRLELRAGHEDEAVSALAEHRRRFPHGRLSAEALFLEASAERERGHEAEARALEARLLREHADSPQARRVREAAGQ